MKQNLSLLPFFVLIGCRGIESSPAASDVRVTEAAASPVVDAEDRFETVWAYLNQKYDADGDARITHAEYGRDDERFERLDEDGDGALTRADFGGGEDAGPGGGGGRMQAMMRGMRAQRVMARAFQDDADADELDFDELLGALARMDSNGDEALDQDEFERRWDSLPEPETDPSGTTSMMMNGVDPWDAITTGVDADDDGALTRAEVIAFFDDRDDGDRVWSLGSGRGGQAAGDDEDEISGPAEGTPAPDFTLSSPEGEGEITLSSFRGSKPVALIFGSYT